MKIVLTPAEYYFAAHAGFMRQASNVVRGRQQTYGGASRERGYDQHILGAVGEFVVAKALGLFWPGPGELRGHDCGNLQVRAGSKDSYRLIIHPTDDDADIFVLVTGAALAYQIQGWLSGAECKVPEWWTDPGTGRPAFFVPQKSLRPLPQLLPRNPAAPPG